MSQKIKELIANFSTDGLPFPIANSEIKPQSVTLFFLYLTNFLAIVSIISLHFRADPTVTTTIACIYSAVWAAFYLIGPLHKAKLDLDDRSIELEGEENESSKNDSNT